MRILVLGGTGFAGAAAVAEAVRRGWSVTVLNRGQRGTPPDGVESLHGDRLAPDGLAALAGRDWDFVLDTWSAHPNVVLESARALADSAGRYVYISSRSVYQDPVALGVDESAAVVAAEPDATEGTYAQDKAGAERAVFEVFGDRGIAARAGLILGPGEDVGRLPWWLNRIAAGGRVLAPGPIDLPLQYIDARDLANWLLDNGAGTTSGAFNLVSRTGAATMGDVLTACVTATGSDAELVWTDPEPILAAGVVPWNDLPLWIPVGHDFRWLHEGQVEKAYASGLRIRPITETVADTWAWMRSVEAVPLRTDRPGVGLSPEKEAELLG